VLQDLEGVRQIIENMHESLRVMKQIDQVKEKSIHTFLDNVDRLNARLNTLSEELPELQDADGQNLQIQRREQDTPKQADPEQAIDESIEGLHDELQKLKGDLNELRQPR
jgi:cell division septum initiation protein DivIVA